MNEQMTITELLNELRGLFGNERDKGTAFEKLIKMFLESECKHYLMFGCGKIFHIEIMLEILV